MPLESMDRLFGGELVPRRAHEIVMREMGEDGEVFRENVRGSGFDLAKEEMGEKSAHVEAV